MWSLVRTSYHNGDITRHQAIVSLWFAYGPGSSRETKEFTSYRSIVSFLDGCLLRKLVPARLP